jgi:L-alanine-DL-glutamate epimerase-like enolase superfamily enzyme
MKITDVSVTMWEWKDIPATRYTKTVTSVKTRSSQMGLLRIKTDDGIEGHGFLGSSFGSAKLDGPFVIDSLKKGLMGEDPLARERIWQGLMTRLGGNRLNIICAIDLALWDIAGKAANMPVHKLLGSFRDKIPAYASSAVLDRPEDYAEEAIQHKEAGWAAYKIHPPGDVAEDIRICEAVRRAVGDDYCIMLDSTWAYDYPQAVRVGVAIQEMGFYWYEDPLPYDDIYSYVKLKQALHIPLMATELPQAGPRSYAPWIMEQATDYLRGDVHLKGGITSCMKTARVAETFQMNYEVHHGSNSLNNIANLHMIMAMKNTQFLEVLLPADAQKHAVLNEIEIDKEGYAHANNAPGLGVEIDFDLIERNKLAELS